MGVENPSVPTTQPVAYEIDGTVAVIRLDDGKANAFSHQFLDELTAALDRAEAEARAVVVIGRPGRFSAGFDLATMTASDEAMRDLLRAGTDMLLRLYASPLPIVAACTGHAIAAGALALLVMDLRVGVAGSYRVGLNEVAIGIRLPILAMELATARLVPSAVELALVGELLDPPRALAAGYLDRLVHADDLEREAYGAAARFAALDRDTFRRSKELRRAEVVARIRDTLDDDLATLYRPGPPAGSPA